MTEQFSNFGKSSLSKAIGTNDTTISVASAATFPASGNFRIVVQKFDASGLNPISNPELMLVTAVGGNSFTVTRGAENTKPLAFASGAQVTHIVTAGVMQALVAGGGGVTSLNSLIGSVTLAAGTNITLSPSGNTITISASGGGSGSAITKSIAQTAHGFSVGQVVRYTGTAYALAQADSNGDQEVIGIVSTVTDANDFIITTSGYVPGLSGLTAGTTYFLSPTVAGALTATQPTTSGQISKPLLVADSTTSGYFTNYRGMIVGGAASSLLSLANTWTALQTFNSGILIGTGQIVSTTEFDNGNSGSTITINFNNGNQQKLTLTANCTISFTPPTSGVTSIRLRIIQGGGGPYTITWPTMTWAGGVKPPTASAAATDIAGIEYSTIDVSYQGVSSLNFI